MNQHFITRVRINHVRHLQNIEIHLSDAECKHLILTGRNGSGKTSVMEALASFLSLYTKDDQEYRNVSFNRKRLPELREEVRNAESDTEKQLTLAQEIKQAERYLARYDLGAEAEFHDEVKMRSEAYAGKYIFAYYPAEREYQAQNESNIEKVNLQDSYGINDRPGKNFVKYILNLKAVGAMGAVEGKRERAREVEVWFENFDKVLQLIFDDPKAHLDFDMETFAFHIIVSGREPFAFDTLSSGYAAVLDIVVDLMMRMEKNAGKHYDSEGVVLIDEIETHLHLSLQKKIMPILTKLFPNIQFIVTTHSPFILNSIADAVIYDLENCTLVNGPEGLSNVPYDGIVEGYFRAPALSDALRAKYEQYKEIAHKKQLTDGDYDKLADLEYYLDEIPDYLGLDFMADYKKLKLELSQRG